MGDVGAKVAANYDVPKWRVSSVQLFLDEVGNVLLGVKSVHGCLGQFHYFTLEHLVHVGILDLHLQALIRSGLGASPKLSTKLLKSACISFAHENFQRPAFLLTLDSISAGEFDHNFDTPGLPFGGHYCDGVSWSQPIF